VKREALVAVAVVGGAECTSEEAALAEEVGRLLARRGVVLVCGGRGGVMEAACRGALSEGGMTVGLLPGTEHGAGNPFLTIALPTGLGEARNALVALAGRTVIAIGGGHGTLSEIGLALKSARRMVGLATWQAFQADGTPLDILRADTPQEAVDLALATRSPAT